MRNIKYFLLGAVLLVACAQSSPAPIQLAPSTTSVVEVLATSTTLASITTIEPSEHATTPVPAPPSPAPTFTPEVTSTTTSPTPTSQPSTLTPPTPTTDPFAAYEQFTIPALRERQARGEFGTEGPIEIVRTLEDTPNFTRQLFAYHGDGLRLTGMLNRPKGNGPFPVVILVHGYYPLDVYQTGNGTKLAADYLASRGFLTLSPDLRSHAGSDVAPNLFRAGHVLDVLNLIPLAQRLPYAKSGKVGLWGHSNGGAIAAKVMTISDQVGATVIYSPASLTIAEDYQFRLGRSHPRITQTHGARTGVIDTVAIEFPVKADQAPDLYRRLSPLPYVQYATMPIQIHWGTADETVPRKWPRDLYDSLQAAGKQVRWFEYPGQPHSFQGAGNQLYLERIATFYRQWVA
ncbi:MAG: alpha/beta fold hydrolase [Herpetosiphonaceae bacterium]|nr:alpha/beta fold hydrolase [Herpetosiphonaceae bacterium]